MFAKAIFHIRQKLTPIPIPIPIMCNIVTDHPDAHVASCLSHIQHGPQSVLAILFSVVEKTFVDVGYLRELEGHKMLTKPLPSREVIRAQVVTALHKSIAEYKKSKQLQREDSVKKQMTTGKPQPQVHEWKVPKDLPEKLAGWLVADFLK